jgi:uncharacterized membrane protein YebE (DUF533 family)
MFDAKSLLNALIQNAGKMGQGAQPGGQQLGGLGGILGQVMSQIQNTAQQAGNATQQAGGVGGVIGSVFRQATQGVSDAASRVDQATGAREKADGFLRQATGGKGSAEVLAQIQQMVAQNQGAAGALLGGVGGLLLGTKTGRSIAVDAAKLGGLVLVGGLAYKAYQNYREGKPLIQMGEPVQPAPAQSSFNAEAGDSQQNAVLMLRAMIAAAASDGLIDETERKSILGNVQALGVDKETLDFLENECRNPADAATLAAAASGPEQAAQLYTAARLAIDVDNEDERQFMADLAGKLHLDAALVAQLEAASASVKV